MNDYKKNSPQVLILGAGITGLSSAYYLAKKGISATVFDSNQDIGGLAGSLKLNDCIFDYGPHAFHSRDNSQIEWYYELLGSNCVIAQDKFVQIKFLNKYYDYPIKPLKVIMNLNPFLGLHCASSYLRSFLRQILFNKQKIISAEDFFINRYGRNIYKLFFEGYTNKVWGIHPKELSALFIRNRMPKGNLWQLFIKSKKQKFDSRHETPIKLQIYYPKEGGSITFPLKLAREAKCKIHLETHVKHIHLINGLVSSIEVEKKGKRRLINGTHIISTIPITTMIKSLVPEVSNNIKKAVDSIYYRGIIIVCLIIRKSIMFKPQTIYFTHNIFNRLSQMNSYSPLIGPSNKCAITAEITANVGDEIWEMQDEILIKKVKNEIVAEGFVSLNDFEDTMVLRYQHGYPIYNIGFEKSLCIIREFVAKIPNLYTGGRQGLFNYSQMHFCVTSGFDMAKAIISGKEKLSPQNFDPDTIEEMSFL